MSTLISDQSIKYQGGENIDLQSILIRDRKLGLENKVKHFAEFINANETINKIQCRRKIVSEAGPEVLVEDRSAGGVKKLLMFGSNNYLGFAAHPFIKERVKQAVDKYGVGVGGPPLLNGYTILHKELEDRLSYLKGTEDTLIFGSGYSTNVGLLSCLVNPKEDVVFYDAYSHASFYDGLRMSRVPNYSFHHNDCDDLLRLLAYRSGNAMTSYIGVEGVYSMDGDVAPLDQIVGMARNKGAIVILDDAHGTLVLGKNGGGTTEEFGLEGKVDIIVGTFSKAFAVSGGFISASREIINYLRFLARSYMFSASLPIPTVAAVLAGLELFEKEPELRLQLLRNTQYVAAYLRQYGIVTEPKAAIIALRVPEIMNARQVAYKFQELGIFINSIEYPAVPRSEQRIRISIMANHTREHLDRLIDAVDMIWN